MSSNESIASVVIAEHNNARGIIEFDSSFVVTVKPSSNFLLLRRKAGAYGVVRGVSLLSPHPPSPHPPSPTPTLPTPTQFIGIVFKGSPSHSLVCSKGPHPIHWCVQQVSISFIVLFIWCFHLFTESPVQSPLQVTASWSTIPGSATAGSDYVPTSGTVTFQQGDTLVPGSLAIIDDNIPRFNQSFTVILTSVGGGAVLGTVLNATVIILASHDPNGALGE